MDQQARTRLESARGYMRGLEDELDATGESRFSMSGFVYKDTGREKASPRDVLEGCRTAACLAGHIPAIDPQFTRQVLAASPDLDWEDLGTRFAGLEAVDPDTRTKLWVWLYSDHWADIDNTPGAAADRIDALLRDEIPDTFMEDLTEYLSQRQVPA